MNKFKKTMDKIVLDEYEKEKMLRHILNHEKDTKKTYKTKFIPRLAVFLLAFILVSSSCYALVKVFKIDDKFAFLFGKTEEELQKYGVSGTDVSKAQDFEDATITIEQTILDEKEVYILLSVTGKTKDVYLEDAYLSSGNTFDEAILERIQNREEKTEVNCSGTQIYGCYGIGLSFVKEEELKKGYALSISIDGEMREKEEVTLRLISTNNKIYDLPFTLNKNDMKVKEIKETRVVYENQDLTASVSAIRITPLHIIVDFAYSKSVENLTDLERENLFKYVYNDESSDASYITYQDGTKAILRMEGNMLKTMVGSNGDKENRIHDIEQVKSITINYVTFEI